LSAGKSDDATLIAGLKNNDTQLEGSGKIQPAMPSCAAKKLTGGSAQKGHTSVFLSSFTPTEKGVDRTVADSHNSSIQRINPALGSRVFFG
jgi:hypothetical protein